MVAVNKNNSNKNNNSVWPSPDLWRLNSEHWALPTARARLYILCTEQLQQPPASWNIIWWAGLIVMAGRGWWTGGAGSYFWQIAGGEKSNWCCVNNADDGWSVLWWHQHQPPHSLGYTSPLHRNQIKQIFLRNINWCNEIYHK